MTTFTMQDLNKIEVTKEMEEKMEALNRTMGEPLPNPTTQDVLNNLAIPQTPDINTIINTICTQLQLLSTVIKEGAGKGNSLNAEDQSLQDCVSATLEQAEWFKEMVEEKVEELIDDKDFEYEIGSAVETYFSNSFSLDDHVDIEAEIESKVEDIVERIVQDKLNDATVSISF